MNDVVLVGSGSSDGCVVVVFNFDSDGGFVEMIMEIVKVGFYVFGFFFDFDFFDVWGIDWENVFNVFVVVDMVYGECFVDVRVFVGNDDVSENLDVFFVVFVDFGVNVNVIVNFEWWEVVFYLVGGDFFNDGIYDGVF